MLEPSQQVPGFSPLQQIWLMVMDFPAGKSTWSLERTGFVFFSKENQFRWCCLETREGEGRSEGRKEGEGTARGERMGQGVPAIQDLSGETGCRSMPLVCTHTHADLHAHTHTCTHRQAHTRSSAHIQPYPHTWIPQPSSITVNSRQWMN